MASIMTSRQAAEVDHALERNGWTAEDIKKVSEGDNLTLIRKYLVGIGVLVSGVVWNILSLVATTMASFTARPDETGDSFFTNRPGLWISPDFRRFFGSLLNDPLPSISQALAYHKLTQRATNFDIEKEFKSNNTPFIFSNPLYFLSMLAGLLIAQWGGKPGPLSTGTSNLFYIEIGDKVLTVHVCWFAGRGGWLVRACRRGRIGWGAGSQVFRSN